MIKAEVVQAYLEVPHAHTRVVRVRSLHLWKKYIYFYNYQRFQTKLKQRMPIEYRHALAT
ncbi:IS3 family transposase [Paenibacillus kribbensis]|uniref:IS3 family transposase n=1 Tax=Paenibacillus kribbensis TaxID=172713 RepID=UPI003CC6BD6D